MCQSETRTWIDKMSTNETLNGTSWHTYRVKPKTPIETSPNLHDTRGTKNIKGLRTYPCPVPRPHISLSQHSTYASILDLSPDSPNSDNLEYAIVSKNLQIASNVFCSHEPSEPYVVISHSLSDVCRAPATSYSSLIPEYVSYSFYCRYRTLLALPRHSLAVKADRSIFL